MSHEFETGFMVGEPAWHGLGIVLENSPQTAQEAIEQAGLNWEIGLEPIFSSDKQVEGYSAITRKTDGQVYGICKGRYVPLQNIDKFGFFDPLVKAGVASYETAGSLKNGERVWILAKILGDDLEVTKGDTFKKYLLLSDSNDGKHGTICGFNPERVVCHNTLQIALRNFENQNVNTYRRIVHSTRQLKTLEKVRESLNFVNQTFDETLVQYKRFLDTKVQDVEAYFKNVLKIPIVAKDNTEETKEKQNRTLNKVISLYKNHPTNNVNGIGGSLWAAYNAVTYYVDHERSRGEAGDRLNNSWFGPGLLIKQRAFNEAQLLAA